MNLPQKISAALELMRPANILTAFADILAGTAAVGALIIHPDLTGWADGIPHGPGGDLFWLNRNLLWLLLSTFGLYGGGVVFNDLLDAELDARERPERAIPSGRMSRQAATWLGSLLLLSGITAGFIVSPLSGLLAVTIAAAALFYDAIAKHSSFWGPFWMGSCRGLNLLLGMSLIPTAIGEVWFLSFIPLIYIFAVTLVSQGEVTGGTSHSGWLAFALVSLVTTAFILLSFHSRYHLMSALPFVALFGFLVLIPFAGAAVKPSRRRVRAAVRRGVLSLIVLNSALAAGFAGWVPGLMTLLLLPLSLLLARMFSVT